MSISSTYTASQVEDWMIDRLAAMLDIDPETISRDTVFSELGISSIQAIELATEIEDSVGREITPTLVYEYPTIGEAVSYVIAASRG
ncbi:acyl carrier protein [Haloactinomyces albus]|uniref:Acyl carrier protein n=1 Tax=Haloactinomyces albus TaxID=1352928 RepID=A0AAE4CQ30_9ACTN|nr:acyl carrier protein [Haloactinomyces albus]MDR7303687.1 acyl carrier protein [Haloactinomyces albus]